MTIGQRRRAQGLCRDCNDTPMVGRSLCAAHLERNRRYQYGTGKRARCVDCGGTFRGNSRRCDGCFKNTRGGFTHSALPPRTLARCDCGVTVMDTESERERHARSCAGARYTRRAA